MIKNRMAKKASYRKLIDYPARVSDSGFGEIADRLMAVGYDQALRDMLVELDEISSEWGVDFQAHLQDMLKPKRR